MDLRGPGLRRTGRPGWRGAYARAPWPTSPTGQTVRLQGVPAGVVRAIITYRNDMIQELQHVAPSPIGGAW